MHFGGKGMGPEWFEHSHKAASAAWNSAWAWAKAHAGKAAVVGFAHAKDMVASAMGRVQGGVTCVRQLEAIDRVGFAFDVDGSKVGARLTFESGWRGAARSRAICCRRLPAGRAWPRRRRCRLQWNLDLDAMTAWLEPCVRVATSDPDPFAGMKQFGVRTARAIVLSVDPGDKSWRGRGRDGSGERHVPAERTSTRSSHFCERQDVRCRIAGTTCSIPFVAKLDYVFDDKLAIAAMGDGVMDRVAAGAPGGVPPMFSVSVVPDGMPQDAWVWLLDQIDAPGPKHLVERLQSWAELHATAALDGSTLVVEVAGTHK